MKMIPMQASALARIQGGDRHPEIRGVVRFYALACGVLVEADVMGLPSTGSGFLGFHIHEGSGCGGERFADSQSHYDPDNLEHPFHAGDLPPLLRAGDRGYLCVLTDRFFLRDVLYRTVVLHDQADDFRSQPAGDSGEKIACGVIIPCEMCLYVKDKCHRKKEKC